LALAFGLLSGGIVGAYATTTVYGRRQQSEPVKTCPVCPVCEVCPPPADCAVPPPIPVGPPPSIGSIEIEPLPVDPDAPPKPGLPATAIGLASAGLRREIEPCLEAARARSARASLLLDLTVTATSGIGHIRAVDVVRAEGDAEELAGCLVSAATRVQFDWSQDDGESRLKYPIKVGD